MATSRYSTVHGEVTALTESAALLNQDGDETWIPGSQIDEFENVAVGDSELSVTTWFADKKNL